MFIQQLNYSYNLTFRKAYSDPKMRRPGSSDSYNFPLHIDKLMFWVLKEFLGVHHREAEYPSGLIKLGCCKLVDQFLDWENSPSICNL